MREMRGSFFWGTKWQRWASSFWAEVIQSGDDVRNRSLNYLDYFMHCFLEEEGASMRTNRWKTPA